MERIRIGSSGSIRRRMLTEEEWLRINQNLQRLEKLRKNDSGTGKTPLSLVPLPRATSKVCERAREEELRRWNTKSVKLPEREQTGSALMSDKIKEEIIIAAKKILFENKDYARRLLHGLRLSSVLHERNKQIDFNRKLRNMVDAMKREIKSKMIQESKNYQEEMAKDERKKREMCDMIRKELDKQITSKIEGRRREEAEKAREGIEIARMNEELKSSMKMERDEAEMKKERLRKEIENYKESERKIQEKLKTKEVEQEEVNKIYQKVAREMDKRRRAKEKAPFAKLVKLNKEIFREAKEPLKIRSDGSEKLKSFLQMRETRKKALLNDLLAGKKIAEEEAERRRREEESERAMSGVRRRRKAEADRLRSLKEREERRKVQSNLRKCYFLQSMERKETEKEEKEIEKFYVPDFTEENKLIADYCEEVIRFVQQNRRPVFPVAVAVKDIKREFGLKPVRNLNFLKSNVPINK